MKSSSPLVTVSNAVPDLQKNAGSGSTFFAAYVGSSMNPTLREPEIMEIMPYLTRPVRVGDVAFFMPLGADHPVVHRIIRVTSSGISTLGDNNTKEDVFLLQTKNIKGRVVAAWRGQKRRKIVGGLQGRLKGLWLHWRRTLVHGLFPLLNPPYQVLSRWGLIAWFLPPSLKPKVVDFRVKGRDQFYLLLGKRIIGRYDSGRHQWQIERPFHLFVNGRALPCEKDREWSKRKVLTEWKRTMSSSQRQEVLYNLVLADGCHWEIFAGDTEAASIVSQLGCAMKLSVTSGAIETPDKGNLRRLFVHVDARSTTVADCHVPLASKNDGAVVCILTPCDHWGGPYVNLVRLSLIFAREAQNRGGILIHGALAERDGMGVIMAAPGGTGKTTASNRLPAPWRSLSDDTTLVVRDARGNYWAHPWPTWSNFQEGGVGGSWDAQSAVPLKGIFILRQAVEDRVEWVGPGHAVSMLVECVRQASMFMPIGLFKEEIRAQYLERFDNLCALARVIPVHLLHISLTGKFWHKIEQVLKGVCCEEKLETIIKN